MTRFAPHRGYIALISVLAISFALMTFAMLAAENGLLARVNTTILENRIVAAHDASSCAFAALLNLAQDASYRPKVEGEIVWITAERFCVIVEADENGDHANAKTMGKMNESMSRLSIEAEFASSSKATITEWLEL